MNHADPVADATGVTCSEAQSKNDRQGHKRDRLGIRDSTVQKHACCEGRRSLSFGLKIISSRAPYQSKGAVQKSHSNYDCPGR